jgi:flagellar protein FlgJ
MGYGTISTNSMQSLAADAKSLGALKMQAGKSSPAAIKETAKQFESLFMRELMKSMREATMKSGMLDSPGGDLGTDLLDQQFAVQMSGQPGGLSDLIAQQLTRQMGNAGAAPANPGENVHSPNTVSAQKAPVSTASTSLGSKSTRRPTESQSNFVQKHAQVATEVEKATGIPANFMLGQAGHETGWGKFEIKVKGGASSHNLFGIKAGPGWTGKTADVTTTEFVNGVAQKRVASFRAYDSYADAFKDYARMISESPRYAKAREQTGSAQAYASSLQKAGYATDPHYADKLSQAINTTQQIRGAQA